MGRIGALEKRQFLSWPQKTKQERACQADAFASPGLRIFTFNMKTWPEQSPASVLLRKDWPTAHPNKKPQPRACCCCGLELLTSPCARQGLGCWSSPPTLGNWITAIAYVTKVCPNLVTRPRGRLHTLSMPYRHMAPLALEGLFDSPGDCPSVDISVYYWLEPRHCEVKC